MARQGWDIAMKTTRSIALGFALALSGSTSALAASYEYDNPLWYSPYGPAQPYLAQIGITPDFHKQIQSIIAASPAAKAIKIAILDGRVDNRQIDLTRVAYARFIGGITRDTTIMARMWPESPEPH